MNDKTVKKALSYALGSDLHEAWRAPRKKEDGTYEPRMKKSKDEAWTTMHGTDDVDIANCTFSELPSNWQYENFEAARVAIELVYDKTIAGQELTSEDIEKMAAVIHEEWLKRNPYIFGPVDQGGKPEQALPYAQLSEEEKNKDRVQLAPAVEKVKAYKQGEIDIEALCEQYGIQTERTI